MVLGAFAGWVRVEGWVRKMPGSSNKLEARRMIVGLDQPLERRHPIPLTASLSQNNRMVWFFALQSKATCQDQAKRKQHTDQDGFRGALFVRFGIGAAPRLRLGFRKQTRGGGDKTQWLDQTVHLLYLSDAPMWPSKTFAFARSA
jgi:hypothetical protein